MEFMTTWPSTSFPIIIKPKFSPYFFITPFQTPKLLVLLAQTISNCSIIKDFLWVLN